MKSLIYSLILFMILISQNVYSQNNNPQTQKQPEKLSGVMVVVEGSFLMSTEAPSGPTSNSGWGYGYGGAFGIDFVEQGESLVQLRFEVYYNKWTEGSNSYWRMPFILDLRIFPLQRYSFFKPYFDAGFEISGDRLGSGEDVHFGFTPGAGIEFRFSAFYFGFNARYHLIKYPYLSLQPYVGLRF